MKQCFSGKSVRKFLATSRGGPLFPSGTYGTAEISSSFPKLSSFQSPISRKQLREIELQMKRAILFGWFANFGKTLTIIQWSSLVYYDKW